MMFNMNQMNRSISDGAQRAVEKIVSDAQEFRVAQSILDNWFYKEIGYMIAELTADNYGIVKQDSIVSEGHHTYAEALKALIELVEIQAKEKVE